MNVHVNHTMDEFKRNPCDSNSGTVDKEHRFDDKSRHQCALSEHMQAHRFVHVCVWAHLCVHTHVVHISKRTKLLPQTRTFADHLLLMYIIHRDMAYSDRAGNGRGVH